MEHIKNSILAERIIHQDMHGLDHEEVWVIFLTAANTVITKEMVAKGTLKSALISNQVIFRRALLNNAASIILFHNHPSGDHRPSQADIQMTSRINSACKIMDIRLLDHIIVTDDSFYSFAEEKAHYHDV